ncbi:hypothetical protein [Natrinema pellirubrum]|uniref:hypothetical protein n=1 Tax=Natrinema pellirubrum TaxID=69525 RepID=UPI00126848EF|nr:hypothetical protein [Natrinema pellirubrum]
MNSGSIPRIELNGTELLLLALERDGKVSDMGYKFYSDLRRANYSGDPSGDTMGHQLVEDSHDRGDLRKIWFYVSYPEDPFEGERNVQLRVYEDGHIPSTQPVEPNLFDEIVDDIDKIKRYRDYLSTIDELIDLFLEDEYRTTSRSRRRRIASKFKQSFEDSINEYFDYNNYSETELELYMNIFANLGVGIIDSGVPDTDDIDGVHEIKRTEFDNYSEDKYTVDRFFELYADHVLDIQTINQGDLANHLNYILSIRKDLPSNRSSDVESWAKPLSLIDHIREKYELA